MARHASGMRMSMRSAPPRTAWLTFSALMALLWNVETRSEPYLAVNEGLQCSACHSHSAGGGKRNAFGNVYAQNELAATRIGDADAELWSGALNKWISIGANMRGSYRYVDTPNSASQNAFDVTRATLYLESELIANRLSVYVDQQVAPNASQNREAYVKLKDSSGRFQLVAGQFYLPFGLRLQDDTAFVRQVTGINFTNPDRGVQLGFESGAWSSQISLTNGSGGGSETNSGKQFSGVVHYTQRLWRAGGSVNVNNSDVGDRQMANLFGGLRTGPVVWLAEADWINDEIPGSSDREGLAGLFEGNWLFRKGHNIKVSYDYFDPDTSIDEDHRVRYSLVWEHSPMQFIQGRFGIRLYDGPPQVDVVNRDELFVELHGFF